MSDLRARAIQLVTNEPDLCMEIARLINDRTLSSLGLTERQRELYEFIAAYIGKRGVAPNYDEMRDHLGVSSKSTISEVLACLKDRGVIRWVPNRARAIQIIGGI
jgi:hypothetical protein